MLFYPPWKKATISSNHRGLASTTVYNKRELMKITQLYCFTTYLP